MGMSIFSLQNLTLSSPFWLINKNVQYLIDLQSPILWYPYLYLMKCLKIKDRYICVQHTRSFKKRSQEIVSQTQNLNDMGAQNDIEANPAVPIPGFYKSTLMVSTFITTYRILMIQKPFNSASKTLQNHQKPYHFIKMRYFCN